MSFLVLQKVCKTLSCTIMGSGLALLTQMLLLAFIAFSAFVFSFEHFRVQNKLAASFWLQRVIGNVGLTQPLAKWLPINFDPVKEGIRLAAKLFNKIVCLPKDGRLLQACQ